MSGGEIPRGAAIAIDDLLDHCAEIKAGQEVVLLATSTGHAAVTIWSTRR